jgi:hypothetical protein
MRANEELFEDALVEEEPTSTPPVAPLVEGGGGEEREEEELEEEGTMTTMAGLLESEEGRGIHAKLEPFLDQFKHAVDELERECALIAENAKADADECAREAFKILSDLERKSEEMEKKNLGTRQDQLLIKQKSLKRWSCLRRCEQNVGWHYFSTDTNIHSYIIYTRIFILYSKLLRGSYAKNITLEGPVFYSKPRERGRHHPFGL